MEKPTSHKFRHTFVRILLERGVPVADVAELIGDTEQVLRRSYAAGYRDAKTGCLEFCGKRSPTGKRGRLSLSDRLNRKP